MEHALQTILEDEFKVLLSCLGVTPICLKKGNPFLVSKLETGYLKNMFNLNFTA